MNKKFAYVESSEVAQQYLDLLNKIKNFLQQHPKDNQNINDDDRNNLTQIQTYLEDIIIKSVKQQAEQWQVDGIVQYPRLNQPEVQKDQVANIQGYGPGHVEQKITPEQFKKILEETNKKQKIQQLVIQFTKIRQQQFIDFQQYYENYLNFKYQKVDNKDSQNHLQQIQQMEEIFHGIRDNYQQLKQNNFKRLEAENQGQGQYSKIINYMKQTGMLKPIPNEIFESLIEQCRQENKGLCQLLHRYIEDNQVNEDEHFLIGFCTLIDNDIKKLLDEIYVENSYNMDNFEKYYSINRKELLGKDFNNESLDDLSNYSIRNLIDTGHMYDGYYTLLNKQVDVQQPSENVSESSVRSRADVGELMPSISYAVNKEKKQQIQVLPKSNQRYDIRDTESSVGSRADVIDRFKNRGRGNQSMQTLFEVQDEDNSDETIKMLKQLTNGNFDLI